MTHIHFLTSLVLFWLCLCSIALASFFKEMLSAQGNKVHLVDTVLAGVKNLCEDFSGSNLSCPKNQPVFSTLVGTIFLNNDIKQYKLLPCFLKKRHRRVFAC